jgi:hypothetical protein
MGRYADNLKEQAKEQAADVKYIDTNELESAISSGVQAGITAAIGEGGAIETWADGRYEAKSE